MNLPDSHQLEQIKNAIFAGHKIEAIRLHRMATGIGLKEAKEAVEHLETELRRTEDHRFVKAAARSGCLGALAFCLLAILLVTGCFR